MMEQLGYDVPVNLEEIIKDEMEEDTEEELEVEELTEQEPNIIEQLSIVTETLDTLRDVTQDGIMTSWSLNDYVVQNNIIDYQKAVRKFQRKNRRMQWKK